MYKQRIAKELLKLSKDSDTNCIYVDENTKEGDNYIILSATIIGPDESPYHNGVFRLEVYLPERYPFSPPSIKFITKIYHPNIDDAGRICLDLMKMPPAGRWKPNMSIEGLLIAIRMLMESPNPDDPLMPEIAQEFKLNKKLFNEKAAEYTKTYAMISTHKN
ncbi:ubiquitin-conjugating enzyme E2 T-like [Coccinella septempunctata]|uniref:ubiquitin-conjugating enzyme E2 T-like n=1 Tax=Coccinella septempunctata TaxID=41139 RepID=UPI001D07C1D8|nr:ubiquitin-conjugating enzyme E2 T-like [Coccinella septempunctata]